MRRQEGQRVRTVLFLTISFIADNIAMQYQGTARQGERRRDLEEKPRNPYANLKTAKREQTSNAAVGASILYLLQAMVADLCV